MSNTSNGHMLDDYTDVFAAQQPVRGKYFERAMRSKRLVEIDVDLLEAFPDARELNGPFVDPCGI